MSETPATAAPEGAFEEGYFTDYAGRGEYRDYRLKRLFRTRLAGRFVPLGGRILEIGCAYGYLLRALEDRYECEGIDVSEHAIAVAKTITKAAVESGDVGELLPQRAGSAYDAVLAFDVLEHLPEQQIPGVLREIARVLRPGGRLLVAVPNTKSLSRKLKKEQWTALLDPTHISLLPPERWLALVGDPLTVVATGGDALWDVPYLPRVPMLLQRGFLLTCLLAAATRGRFPRSLSENLIVAAQKR